MTAVDRRGLLQLAGAGALATVVVPTEQARAVDTPSVGQATDDTLVVAINRDDEYSWDPVEMLLEDEFAVVEALVYERPFRTGVDGELIPWLVTDWTVRDAVDISLDAYEPFALTREEASDRGGIVLETLQSGSGTPNDIVLDHIGGAEAAEAGVYGVAIELSVREGVSFHDGTELTADHLANSIRRYLDTPSRSFTESWFLHAEAEDDHTAVVYAQEADATVLRRANLPVVQAAGIDDPAPGDIHPHEAVQPHGTGPFRIDEFSHDGTAVLERFEDHWFADAGWFDEVGRQRPPGFPDRPVIEAVEVRPLWHDVDRADAVIDGQVDLARGFGTDQLVDLETNNVDLQGAVTSDGRYLFMPHGTDPWSPALRWAVSQLFDRVELAEGILKGFDTPARSHLSPSVAHPVTDEYEAFVDGRRDRYEFDFGGALAILEELEMADGIDPPLSVVIRVGESPDAHSSAAAILADMLDETGYFDATVEVEPVNDLVLDLFMNQLASDELAILALNDGTGLPDTLARSMHHSDHLGMCCNLSGIDRGDIDAQLDEARYDPAVVGDSAERRSRYQAVYETLADEMATAPLTFRVDWSAVSDELVGFKPHPAPHEWLRHGLWSPTAGRVAALGEVSVSFDETVVDLPLTATEPPVITGTSTLEAGATVEVWYMDGDDFDDAIAGPMTATVDDEGEWAVTAELDPLDGFTDGAEVELVVLPRAVGPGDTATGVVGRPDLVWNVESVTLMAELGDEAMVEATITNDGGSVATEVEVVLSVFDATDSTVIDAIEAGASTTASLSVPVEGVDPGSYGWTLEVDGEEAADGTVTVEEPAPTPSPTPDPSTPTPSEPSDGIPGPGIVGTAASVAGLGYVLRWLSERDDPEA